jgi:hypothetical protein
MTVILSPSGAMCRPEDRSSPGICRCGRSFERALD